MAELQNYWNKSSASIPGDKDTSAYAVSKQKLFPRNAYVCDLGGGSGADSLYFASKGHRVKLIDISDVALLHAEATALKQGLGAVIEVEQFDMSDGDVPLESETCDVVYSRLSMHYFESDVLSKLLADIYRILKPGGKAFLTLKSPDDTSEMAYLTGRAVRLEDNTYLQDGIIKTRFSIEQLEGILSGAHIPTSASNVCRYSENLGGRNDKVKSGNAQLVVNEISIQKPL